MYLSILYIWYIVVQLAASVIKDWWAGECVAMHLKEGYPSATQ